MKAKPSGCFGLEFQKAVTLRGLTIADLHRRIKKRQSTVSRQFLNMLAIGARTPSPETINLIASALSLPLEHRRRLHHAAALDAGYEIGPV